MKPVSAEASLSQSGSESTLKARPTISDVATACGLSKATVSKVLNIPPEACPIAEPTRARVLEAVERLGYRPSWQGRTLANRRTHMIAVVNADPYGALPRGQYWGFTERLDEQMASADLVPVYIHTYGSNPRSVAMLGDRRFDACLSLDVQPPEVMDVLRRNNTPTVMVNADVDAEWTHLSFDDKLGAEQLMAHLIGLGHKRIAYNAGRRPNTHSSAIIRAQVYATAMREAGLEPDKPFVGPVDEFVDRCVNGPYKPTAIVDYEHWTAVHVLQHLWRHGLRVPHDMSVATFNDTYPTPLVVPPLTVVGTPMRDVCDRAMQWLTELIDDPKQAPRAGVFPQTLVVRESTAPPPS